MKPSPRFSLRSSLALAVALLACAGVCPAGALQVLVYDSGSDDRGQAVATDAGGSIFVSGTSGSGMYDTFAVLLDWTDHANNETGFRLERSTSGGAFVQLAQVGVNVRNYNNTGLTKGMTCIHRVRAFNASGSSTCSATASGAPR